MQNTQQEKTHLQKKTPKEAAQKQIQTLVMEEQTLVDDATLKEMQQQTPENENTPWKKMSRN